MSRSGSSDLKTPGVQQEDAAAPRNGSTTSNTPMSRKKRGSIWDKKDGSTRDDGKVELTEGDAYDKLGFNYSNWKKWTIISVIFVIQCSMNFNASVYGNAVKELSKEFSISTQAARSGQGIFLVAYAFGCELWAPWSEEFGRKPILQASLFLVNIWQIPCALAPNFGTIVVCRFLGGISSAGGSVTLGMVADMWEPDNQQYAVAFIVLSSVGGSVLGPVIGGFSERHLSWHWIFWLQLIFGAATQLIHLVFVPETRVTILLDKEAKKQRKEGNSNIYGPSEINGKGISMGEVGRIWIRPFEMFLREPIVLCLSLLSGFSDALIFTFLESYTPVFTQWNFGTTELGLAFIPLLLGYFIAYASFFPTIRSQVKRRKAEPDSVLPEARLWWLLWTAPLEAIGLFCFAWTSLGPPKVHWIAPLIFSTFVGIANYCIYMATVDYMIAAYGPYAASATGGNGFARDFLAGIAAWYATPFYTNISGKYHLEWPTTILGFLAIAVTIPIYVFYYKGPAIRAKSKFAQTLAADRVQRDKSRGVSVSAGEVRAGEKNV